jgi:hypothetical protein
MVICASCMQYADDSRSTCEHCGEPLRERSREQVTRFLGVEPEIAELGADQERALLVASGVVYRSLPHFFFDDGQRRTVLVDLFGSPLGPARAAAALLFVAVAYAVERGYCRLEEAQQHGERAFKWGAVRAWDGQSQSLEGMLIAQAGIDFTIAEALDRVVRQAMDFSFELASRPAVRMPGMPEVPPVRNRSTRTALNGVVEAGRLVALPDHEEQQASAEIYRMLRAFVQADAGRARYLVGEVKRTLDWYAEYERDPSLALTREDLLGGLG